MPPVEEEREMRIRKTQTEGQREENLDGSWSPRNKVHKFSLTNSLQSFVDLAGVSECWGSDQT
jgi:hypothetical protein